MLVKTLCQNYFKKSLTSPHATRANALFETSWSVLKDADLSVTSLGRHKDGKAYVKHKVKSVDRLLGNKHLHKELGTIYQEFYQPLLLSLDTLYIAVDWSGCCGAENHMLTASLLHHGRGIAIYTEVYPQAELGSHKAHKTFLSNLAKVIPFSKKVVIVTDGGFYTPWFKEVLKKGWDFVSRLTRNIGILLDEEDEWRFSNELKESATGRVKYIGYGKVGRKVSTPIKAHVYSYKEKSKHRKEKSIYPDTNKMYEKLHNEPWILVTSLDYIEECGGNEIKNIYKRRMQIEQNFRDQKSQTFGMGFRVARVINEDRLPIYCLLANIAAFFLWWIGMAAEKAGIHLRYQANSVRHKRILSYQFLAKQILFHQQWQPDNKAFENVALIFAKDNEKFILCDIFH